MATHNVSISGTTITVGSLPTDGSIPAVAISVWTSAGGKRKTLQWALVKRTDLTNPDLVVDLLDVTPAKGAIVPEFDPAGFNATVSARLATDVTDPASPVFQKGSADEAIAVDAATVTAFFARYPHIPTKAAAPKTPATPAKTPAKAPAATPAPAHPAPAPATTIAPASGGGNGGQPIINIVRPAAPTAPVESPDRARFYIVIAVIVALTLFVFGVVTFFGWMVYKTPAVVTVHTVVPRAVTPVDTTRRNEPLQIRTRDVPTGQPSKPMLASNGPKEINTVIGELPPLPVAKPVQSVVQHVAAAPVYASYDSGMVSSYSASYHAGGSSTYTAPVTYSRQPPIDVTRVQTVRGNGYVLTSSPAFGVAPDLVGAGSNFRVVANYRENRSGRRN